MIRYIFVYLYICVLLMLLRNMSSKAKNKKEEKKGEEQDFETFVRVTLGKCKCHPERSRSIDERPKLVKG